MAVLVCFHAHPDDEAIATGGTMALAATAGHDVVLVLATGGEHGEAVPGVLAEGEELAARRVAETGEAARLLGVGRVELLGYRDSGMMGQPTNHHSAAFWQADVAAAADRLAALLVEVGADVMTVYDDHGGYGHPDHINVHRVGVRAARRAGVDRVFQSTMNRDHIRRTVAEHAPTGAAESDAGEQARRRSAQEDFGSPEAMITHAVDVGSVLDRKRAAMAAHASQIAPDSFFLSLPPKAFAAAFGTEWYIGPGPARPPGAPFATSLLDDPPP